ncbi:cyclase family protein [bacterium]|nr:cyclase family protein [bacterium]
MKIIDLSQTFKTGMPVFPGEPGATLEEYAKINTHGYSNHKLCINMHTGTHIDAPGHMLENGKLITDFPASKFIGQGILLDARGKSTLDKSIINKKIPKNSIVLLFTEHDQFFGQDKYYSKLPPIQPDLAEKLIQANVSAIGMDMPSPDYAPFDVHKQLFKRNIILIENLTNLKTLVKVELFDIIALPIKSATGGALARVIATTR